MGNIKQVILIRRDLKMRRGKEIAQGSHAAMDFLVERLRAALPRTPGPHVTISLSENERRWISEGMAKVCLQVDSEEQLVELQQKAVDAGLEAHLILDSGRTEFSGQPTLTALAIGPADAETIDKITGHLSLY